MLTAQKYYYSRQSKISETPPWFIKLLYLLALKFAFQIFTFFLFNAEIYIYFILSVNIFWKFQATFQANYSNIALCTFN